jgi:hypothetical protein
MQKPSYCLQPGTRALTKTKIPYLVLRKHCYTIIFENAVSYEEPNAGYPHQCRATAAPHTARAPAVLKTPAHSESVAPVVTTSSTTSTLRPAHSRAR